MRLTSRRGAKRASGIAANFFLCEAGVTTRSPGGLFHFVRDYPRFPRLLS